MIRGGLVACFAPLCGCDVVFNIDHVPDGPPNCTQDNFDAATIDLERWMVVDSGLTNISQTGGALEIRLVPNAMGPAYNGVITRQKYDLTASAVRTQVSDVRTLVPNVDAGMTVQTNDLNKYVMGLEIGLLYFIVQTDTDKTYADVPYNAQTQAFWQIRHDTSTVFFETSPDGLVWSTVHQVPTTVPISNVQVSLQAGTYGTGAADPGVVHFDNFAIATPGCR